MDTSATFVECLLETGRSPYLQCLNYFLCTQRGITLNKKHSNFGTAKKIFVKMANNL